MLPCQFFFLKNDDAVSLLYIAKLRDCWGFLFIVLILQCTRFKFLFSLYFWPLSGVLGKVLIYGGSLLKWYWRREDFTFGVVRISSNLRARLVLYHFFRFIRKLEIVVVLIYFVSNILFFFKSLVEVSLCDIKPRFLPDNNFNRDLCPANRIERFKGLTTCILGLANNLDMFNLIILSRPLTQSNFCW